MFNVLTKFNRAGLSFMFDGLGLACSLTKSALVFLFAIRFKILVQFKWSFFLQKIKFKQFERLYVVSLIFEKNTANLAFQIFLKFTRTKIKVSHYF